MKVQHLAWKLPIAFAVAAGTLVATGSPAAAANDDHYVSNWSGNCQAGRLDFVDHGEGAPGGGTNDDYFVVRDTCANGDGVKARVYLNGVVMGSKYNGGGSGTSIIWDPFQVYENDVVKMEICEANGPTDYLGFNCNDTTFRSIDG
ncbi:hypothetical protein [Micromonospora musae]|uniref:hypothetical protein n=1 Tax=Micromonospora musae TaxID=1894970 RepID=UPI003411AD94